MRGSLVQRYKGTWSLILDLGREHDLATGKTKRRQKWITFRGTRKQAETKLTDLVRSADRCEFVEPSKVTLIAWLRDWVDKAIKPPMRRATTYASYTSIIEKHIAPSALAHMTLQHLRASDLKHDHGDARTHCWTAAEARQFLDTAKADGAQPAAFYTLALDTGARKGELGGLRWSDVDLDAATITIAQQLTSTGAAPTFGPTKTGTTRTVSLGPETVVLLREHKKVQAEIKMKNRKTYCDFGLVFAKQAGDLQTPRATLGQPLQMNNIGQREYARLIKASGVRRIKFHGLRHTSATLSLQAGTPVHVVAARLGHSKVEMTLNVYAHALPNQQQAAAERLGALLHG